MHTYLSAGSSNPQRRAVYVNSVKFYDNEVVIEGEAEQLEEFSHQAYRDFKGTATDLLHAGNVDGVLLLDE